MVFEGAPWNSSTTSLIAAARAHCQLVMLDDFLNSRRSAAATMDPATNSVLTQVGDLWAADTLCHSMGDVLASGILNITQVGCIRSPATWALLLVAQHTHVAYVYWFRRLFL